MAARLFLVSVCLAMTAAYLHHASRPERVPPRQPLADMSSRVGSWTGRDVAKLPSDVLAQLAVDDYLNRIYAGASGPVSLYIGYYQSQRQGAAIHSPMNCLPGAGWQPIETTYVPVRVPSSSQPLIVKRVLIQKGLDRQVVLYWYQSHGRVIANEYWSKAFMIYDAVRLNRSDAALVRVVSPVLFAETTTDGADARVVSFTQALYPRLGEYLPS
jgi:EpsI family protein